MATVELSLTRRELIASVLGAAVAQSACKDTQPRSPVPGAIVDRAVHAGHALREGSLPLHTGPFRSVDVAIVGAGVAGLSAAWRLAAAGVQDVVVCELEAHEGGTARGGRNHVGAFPWGAHYLPTPLHDTGPVMRLLHELGAVEGVDARGRPHFAEHVLISEPEERLFFKGAWYEGLYLRAGASAEDLAQLARFESRMAAFAAARDARGRKAFAVPVAHSSDDGEWTALDLLTMAQWMAQAGFTSRRLQWLVDYACRDDFGTTPESTSAWAGVWYFAARQEGAGGRAEGYLSWPEGNARLVAQLARSVTPRQWLRSTLVHTLEPMDGGCRVHAVDTATGAPVGLMARQVVFCGPRFVAARVLAPWRKAPPAWLSAFTYAPWVVANLTVSAPPQGRGFPLAWDNVLHESRSLGYVVAGHQEERQARNGTCVLTWYYPFADTDPRAGRTRMLSAGYEEWEALVMADLLRPHPELAHTAERLEVMRWGHAMVRPTPGLLWGEARRAAQASVGAVHFAHTDLGGIALFEEANHFGVRAAESALADLGRKVESWL
ncbi:MAG: NAD(P)-binding protein [Myxococcaceae bacterium]|nr:NAD(P)-binding protein [Myxococcaceae bacterium]